MRSRDKDEAIAAEVVTAWGEHLASFEWAHMATLTPRFPDTRPERLARDYQQKFIRNVARAVGRSVPWFYAMERSRGGVFHLHALLGNTESLDVRELRREWEGGISKITRYSSTGAAAWYVAKTLDRPNDRWERWDASRRTPALRTSTIPAQ